ncbi:Diatom spindle kinesin-1 [Lachnellula arida]|uniref:Diatom spindle kinesin-1 n=1 Tax=Lachnellula arida TaxID=1316785 RepID=A0A8T9BPN6_9HELO|nr:Diatom spindle kinesin-1 [Lachnellula arida]
MEDFYLKNIARYESLVKSLGPALKPRVSKGEAGPNMVVSVRIRPLSKDEGFPSAIFPRSTQGNVVDIHDLYNHPRGIPILKSFDYQVDQLFNSESTTKEIYENLVVDLVHFAWNGGIGTLFAYGQTGSGKTFTVSRLEQLVAETLMDGSLAGEGEVYMTIIDLAGNAAFDLLNERTPISLLEDSFGVTQMVGAEEYKVHDKQRMRDLIEHATSFRKTASTLKNDASSRSHAICRIRISHPATNSDGLLYLIDLAGSEAARDVAVHGADRMRETREINTSLSVLKDCVRGKAQSDILTSSGRRKPGQKIPYIPFRQSALTKVLKHAFDPASARACKTVVIACVNPSLADVVSSKNTLRFAEMLRVLVPATEKTDLDPKAPMNWTNAQLKEWIRENSGTPPILPNSLAPRESGVQLLNLPSTEFEYRCQKCPGVGARQAEVFRLKLWQMHNDSQQNSELSKKTIRSKPTASAEPNTTLELKSRMSSRDLDPAPSKLPFKERLRPGMVVSYVMPLERGAALGLPNDPKLAVLLCPEEAIQGSAKDALGEAVNPGEDGNVNTGKSGADNGDRYLCALLMPGQTPDAYELNLWRQIVVDVNSMDAEVHLEYDAATRYYYVSV